MAQMMDRQRGSGVLDRGEAMAVQGTKPPSNLAGLVEREPDGELRVGLLLLHSNLESLAKAIAMLEGAIELVLVPDGPIQTKDAQEPPPPPATAMGADLRQLNDMAARLFDRLTSLRFRVSI
jgi:hypothetical protein